MKINWDGLAQFAFSMATCLSSGMPVRKALVLSAGVGHSAGFRRAVERASVRCERGLPVSEALEPERRYFPSFFLPVIRAGELGGRQIEAYQLVQTHCERLKPTMTLVRNAWLYPLTCILAGWAIQLAIMIYFGRTQMALSFARATFVNFGIMVFTIWLLLQLQPVRLAVDWMLLQVPFVRNTQIGLAVVLFFATFRLAYEAGSLGVLEIFDLALATVGNRAIRQDFLRARPVLDEHGAFEDAFAEPELLEDSIKSSITAGALSGHLGTSLDQIVRREAARLELWLDIFNRVFQRIVAYSVAFSIVETVLLCVLYLPAP